MTTEPRPAQGEQADESLVETPASHASGDAPRDQPAYASPATTQPVEDGDHDGHRESGLEDRQPENGEDAAGSENR